MRRFDNQRLIGIDGVYSAFKTEFEVGERFNGEMHSQWECVCVISGTAGVSADDRVYTLKAGEMIFHKPMEFHRVWNEGNVELEFFVASFDASGVRMEKFEDATFRFDKGAATAFENVAKTCEKCRASGFGGSDAWLADSEKLQMFCNAFETFLLYLSMEEATNAKSDKTEQAKIFHLLVKTMKNNLNTTLTVKELAEKAHTSETGVKRIFAKYSGCSPHAYFLNLKLKEAYKLLGQNYRISEISEKLGFDNPNYFAVVFKRLTGLSPQNYKKKYLK